LEADDKNLLLRALRRKAGNTGVSDRSPAPAGTWS
jgi:hypothetical protein